MSDPKMDIYLTLATLAENPSPLGFTPCSHIYLALGSDLTRWERVKYVLQSTGLADITAETITLTPKGREAGLKVAKVLAEAEREAKGA